MSNRWGRDGEIGSLASVLPGVAESIGLPLPPSAEEAWNRAVGDGIARHCRPLSLRNGVLRIGVDSRSWMKMLDELASTLPGRLAREGLTVERIDYRLTGPG